MVSRKFRKPQKRKSDDFKRFARVATSSNLIIKNQQKNEKRNVEYNPGKLKEKIEYFGKFKFALKVKNLLFRLDTLEDVPI